jgi:hypothetical protein
MKAQRNKGTKVGDLPQAGTCRGMVYRALERNKSIKEL